MRQTRMTTLVVCTMVLLALCMFGNRARADQYNPVIDPDRWLADFDKLAIKPEVRPLIMKENAARLLFTTRLAPIAPLRGAQAEPS